MATLQRGVKHCLTCVYLVCLQQVPSEAMDGSSPWEIADGLLYPEDILDDSPYMFVEIPGRLTGSYSGYNVDPLFVTVGIFTSNLQNTQTVLEDLFFSQCCPCFPESHFFMVTMVIMVWVQVNTVMVKGAFVAGMTNGLKPLNVAALKYVDQVHFTLILYPL